MPFEARRMPAGSRRARKHSATCKASSCRIRKEKKNAEDPSKVTWKDAVKTMKEEPGTRPKPKPRRATPANGQHRRRRRRRGRSRVATATTRKITTATTGTTGTKTTTPRTAERVRRRRLARIARRNRVRAAARPSALRFAHPRNGESTSRAPWTSCRTLRMCLEKSGGKMTRLPMPSIKTGELPVWWTSGVHDVAILRAALKHGCDKWDDLRRRRRVCVRQVEAVPRRRCASASCGSPLATCDGGIWGSVSTPRGRRREWRSLDETRRCCVNVSI